MNYDSATRSPSVLAAKCSNYLILLTNMVTNEGTIKFELTLGQGV